MYYPFAQSMDERKNTFMRFCFNLNQFERVRIGDSVLCFFPPVFHLLLSTSIPSFLVQSPEGHSLFSVLGPGFCCCREHVADRLCSLLLLTTVHSPASASILNASKTSGTVQQTKPQPQLTEWTAGLQPERGFDPLCIMFLRVCTQRTAHTHSTHKAQREG